MCFVGDNKEVAHKIAKTQNIVQDTIDHKVMTVALKFAANKWNVMSKFCTLNFVLEKKNVYKKKFQENIAQ